MEQILRSKFPELDLDIDSLQRAAESLGNNSSTKTADSEPDGDGQPVLADDDLEIRPVEGGNIIHYSGEFSYWNFSQRIKRHVEEWMGSTNPDAPNPERVSEFWRPETQLSNSHSLSSSLACCPPRDIADFLTHVFFRHAESNYYFVDRAWLSAVLDTLYNNPSKLTVKDAPKVSAALAIFAVGTQYAYLDSINTSGASHTATNFSEDEIGTLFFEQAAKLLPEIIQVASLESVQACLLMGLYCLPLDASGLAYTYLNLAMKLGMVNGLHRKYTGNAFSAATVETRNRVWWTIYVLLKKVDIFHGRPTSVLRSDVDADVPKDPTTSQSSAPPSNIPYMLASIALMHKLEDFLNEMQLLKRCQRSEFQTILARLLSMKESMSRWFDSLPGGINHEPDSASSVHFRPAMHLRLEHCLVRMFVGRPFLFSRHGPGTTPMSAVERAPSAPLTAGGETEKRPSRRGILIDDCVQAAKEAIATCRRLRDSGVGLARASYIEYSSCRASLLALIAYCIYNQTDRFKDSLQVGLSMIREMSVSGDSARAEVSLIESLERALARLQFFGSSSSKVDTREPTTRSTVSGYDRFKNWQALLKGDMEPPIQNTTAATTNTPTTRISTLDTGGIPIPSQRYHGWSIDSSSDSGAAGFPNMNAPTELDSGAGGNQNPNPNYFQTAADSAFFGLDNMLMPSDGSTHAEQQVLQDFLAIPDFEFSQGMFDNTASRFEPGDFDHGQGAYGAGQNHVPGHW
ncbi:hypothetical protein, variant [Exophiala mesophila]|nr:hypothetical protein, variant [Exophiala mesophila]KIV91208.1 hypothetical protein, variant [Exophiala mesophila]